MSVDSLADKLLAEMERGSVEDVVVMLAQVVLQKKDFKTEQLYRQLLKTMVGYLYVKMMKQE